MRRPAVSIAGGEPLLHRDMAKIVEGYIARDKFVILCTRAAAGQEIDQYKPHPNFTWSIHLDGDKAMHDKSVCQDGTYDRAIAAIKLAKSKGFRTQINCTCSTAPIRNAPPPLRRDDGDGRGRHDRVAGYAMSARPTSSTS